jgi:hypothetical protein
MQSYASIQLQETAQQVAEAPQQKKKIDYHIVLLFINVALVVIGYGLANPTGFASVLPMMILRIIVLGISLVYLFNSQKHYNYLFKGTSSWIMWVFLALNIYVLPFSTNLLFSFNKFVNIVPYFFYLNYLIIYFNRVYHKQSTLNLLLNIFNIVYALPIISYILFGGSVQEEDIYGKVIGGFVSNHYGWTSAIFLATSLDLIKNNTSVSSIRKAGILLFTILAFYILIISGSRSSYLTFVLSFLLFILRSKNTSIAIKIIISFISLYVIISLYGDKDSALNKRVEKTETQLEKGDARTISRRLGFETMLEYPHTIATGFGFFAFREAIVILNPKVSKVVGLHNSYLELLFGSGLFIFVFFLIFFVGKTVWNFAFHHSARYTFLPPLMLIPFFENNFNPGQFLFFPWIAIMFYYIHFNERQIKIEPPALQHTKYPSRKHQFL